MWTDIRIAWRRLLATPVFLLASVGSLALAVGVNGAIVGVVDAALLRSLPYSEPDELFVIRVRNNKTGALSSAVPYEFALSLARSSDQFGALGMRGSPSLVSQVDASDSTWLSTFAVTPSYLQTLGAKLTLGRYFTDEDTSEPGTTVLLSHDFWQRYFGGNRSVVGRPVRLGNRDRIVVGVLGK